MEEKEYKDRIIPMGNWIYKIAKCFLKNREDSEDLRQNVFKWAWIVRQELDKCCSIEAYINSATRFMCIDKLRKEQHEKEALRKQPIEPVTEGDVLDPIDRKYICQRIREIADTLPPDKKDVFMLRWIEGLEYSEIADKYGMTLNLAYINNTRAFKLILEQVQKLKLHELYRD